MACGCFYPAIWVLDELFPLFSIQLPIIAWQKCPFVLVPPVPWVQFSSRTNFGYSGIPSVSSPSSLRSLLFKTCARKSEQFFGNRDFICITGSEGREGARREEGKGRRGVLFANFHDLSRGAGGEREDLQVRSGVARDKAGRMVE